MKKNFKKNIFMLTIGSFFLLTGITLIVLNQNRINFSLSFQHIIIFIHQKLVLDYILIIIGTLLLSIPILFKTLISGYRESKQEIKPETIWKRKKNSELVDSEQ